MEDKSLPHCVLENLQLQKQQVGQKTSQCFHREAGRTTRGSSMHFWVNGMCLSSTPGLARSDTAVLYQRFPMPQTISAGAAEEGKAPAPPLPPATHPCSHDTLLLCLAQQSYGCAAGWISPCAMEKKQNTKEHTEPPKHSTSAKILPLGSAPASHRPMFRGATGEGNRQEHASDSTGCPFPSTAIVTLWLCLLFYLFSTLPKPGTLRWSTSGSVAFQPRSPTLPGCRAAVPWAHPPRAPRDTGGQR